MRRLLRKLWLRSEGGGIPLHPAHLTRCDGYSENSGYAEGGPSVGVPIDPPHPATFRQQFQRWAPPQHCQHVRFFVNIPNVEGGGANVGNVGTLAPPPPHFPFCAITFLALRGDPPQGWECRPKPEMFKMLPHPQHFQHCRRFCVRQHLNVGGVFPIKEGPRANVENVGQTQHVGILPPQHFQHFQFFAHSQRWAWERGGQHFQHFRFFANIPNVGGERV